MASESRLTGTDIVVLARNYNPSIVSKDWLQRKGIITEAVSNFVHTPPFSLIETEQIALTVEEERLQISLKVMNEDNIERLPRIVERFVLSLPETPYVATGFNYSYRLPKEASKLAAFLTPNDTKLREVFSGEYEVGMAVVFRFKDCRVRVTMSPPRDASVVVDFNFHSNTPDSALVLERLKSHHQTREEAERILKELCK